MLYIKSRTTTGWGVAACQSFDLKAVIKQNRKIWTAVTCVFEFIKIF